MIVDGRTLLAGRKALAVDEAKLMAQVQESGERTWEGVSQWHWRGASVDDIAPMSYPLAGE